MIENPAVTLRDEPGRIVNTPDGPQILRFKLDIAGERMSFGVQIARKNIRLSDIVPLARELSERLCRAALQKWRAEGSEIPCRKGCSACCRYLVPLSIPEVFRLREDLCALPAEQGAATLNACLSAAGKILEQTPDNRASGEPYGTNARDGKNRLSRWYAGLDLPCPFLSDGACSCYEIRPIACREHFVTSPAVQCAVGAMLEPSVVPMPVSLLECLGRLAAELEQRQVEAVILPLALPWALKHHDRSARTWPARTMVERFIEILCETTSSQGIETADYADYADSPSHRAHRAMVNRRS